MLELLGMMLIGGSYYHYDSGRKSRRNYKEHKKEKRTRLKNTTKEMNSFYNDLEAKGLVPNIVEEETELLTLNIFNLLLGLPFTILAIFSIYGLIAIRGGFYYLFLPQALIIIFYVTYRLSLQPKLRKPNSYEIFTLQCIELDDTFIKTGQTDIFTDSGLDLESIVEISNNRFLVLPRQEEGQ